MENSALNKAHQQQRRAEALLRQKKFDECIECHRNAIELLNESCKLTENTLSLESLKLQKSYHQKQVEMVQMRKFDLENCKKLLQNQNRKLSTSTSDPESQNDESLEATIHHAMNVHDSLIGYLSRRGNSSDNESYSTSDTEDKIDGTLNVVGNKHPKDDATVIEELKLLSNQLRVSVQCLLNQLDDRNKVIEKLKHKITQLESEVNAQKGNNSLRVVTDSSGGTSPYVFSPCSELSPDVHDTYTLAPLELPNFDYTNLMKNNNK